MKWVGFLVLATCVSGFAVKAETAPATIDLTQPLLSMNGTPMKDGLEAPETDPKCEKPLGSPGACPTLTLGRYLAIALATNYCLPALPNQFPAGWCDDFEKKLTDDQRVARLDRAKVLRTAPSAVLSPEEVVRLKILSSKLAADGMYQTVLAQVWHDIQPAYEPEKIK